MKKNQWIFIVFVLLLVAVMGGVLFLAATKKDTNDETADAAETLAENTETLEKWQEGVVSYNGKRYLYNDNIRTYLFMGVDKDGKAEKSEGGMDGGQSDAMFLLVVDNAAKELSVVAINRNTMTDVAVYDENGDFVGIYELQICLQHGYGDGMRTSCTRAVDAVSNLMYGLPIQGYLAMNMGGISIVNDAVGGVTVTVLEDLENASRGVSLTAGETVTLSGDEAYVYLRSRDTDVFDSATARLERQKQYIGALFEKITDLGLTGAASVYGEAEDYLVTNISFQTFAEDALSCEYDASRMYTVPGETVMGEKFEEYYVDEDALYEMILEVFYEPIEE